MKEMICIIVLLFVVWSVPLTTGDVTVTCLLTSDCLLPCTSNYNKIIHWYTIVHVHSFYDNADQLIYQNGQYKNRTSLFPDQIPQRNVSLLLKNVQINDEDRYRCVTETDSENLEQIILLKVKAPVKQVILNMTSESISCSTEKVYPQPQISWFRDGRSDHLLSEDNLDNKEGGLFSVSSVLTQSVQENTMYTCSFSLGEQKYSYNASLKKVNVEVSVGQNASIHCPVQNDNITLTFNNILIYPSSNLPNGILPWKGKTLHLSSDGYVTIQNFDKEDTGTFRCVRLTPQSRQEVYTSVKMKSDSNHHVIVGIVVAAAVIVCITAILYWKRKKSAVL